MRNEGNHAVYRVFFNIYIDSRKHFKTFINSGDIAIIR